MTKLTPEHREYLNDASITDDVIDAAGLWSAITRDDLPECVKHMTTFAPVPGIVLPYRNREGVEITYRYRPDDPAPDPKRDGKPAKYVGAPGVNVLNFARFDDRDHVLIVEGDKQVLAACCYVSADFDVIGTPGCASWHGTDLSWADGKKITIAFDADRKTNPDVTREARDFPRALTLAGAKDVRLLDPPGDGTDGLDDVLARLDENDRAGALAGWIGDATEPIEDVLAFAYDGPECEAVIREAHKIYVGRKARELADDQIARETGRAIDWERRSFNGADWLADEDEAPKPLWGTADTPLWLTGESLMIVGPPSVGKSTLAHAIIWGALGLTPSTLGHTIEPMEDGGILYLAMDRPKQIKRAMARFIRANPDRADEMNAALRERLTIWEGPLPGDPTVDKRLLVAMAERFGRTRIIVDSIKDLLPNASDEARAGGYNIARQEALAEGLEWVELHHNRKNGVGNKEPDSLDDVYGSRWLTAGAGSVLSLFGEPGDIVLRLKHIKPLGEPIFPTWVKLDRMTGDVSIHEEVTLDDLLKRAGDQGITVEQATRELFGFSEKAKLDKSKVESVRLKLKRLKDRGTVEEFERINSPKRYRLVPDPLGV